MPDKPEKTKLLFICSGNTCRSPMAAAIAQAMLGDGYECSSAGAGIKPCALGNPPIAPNAKKALALLQCGKIEKERATPISEELLQQADRVFYMSDTAKLCLDVDFPDYKPKFEPYAEVPVPDPFDLQDFPDNLEVEEEVTDAYYYVAKLIRDTYTPALLEKLGVQAAEAPKRFAEKEPEQSYAKRLKTPSPDSGSP